MPFYYTDPTNQPVGPVSLEELTVLRRTQQIGDDTLVIEEGASEWSACRTFVASAAPPWTPPAPPAPPSSPHRRGKHRTALAIGAVVFVGLVGVLLLGKVSSTPKTQAQSASGAAATNIHAPFSEPAAVKSDTPPPQSFWHNVLYRGKKADYRLLMASYFQEAAPSSDDEVDRTFVGPGGMVIAAYVVADTNRFWDHLTTAKGLRGEKADPPETLPSRNKGGMTYQMFELTATPVGGQQLLTAVVFLRQGLTYALTLSVPATWGPRLKEEATFLFGQVVGGTNALEVRGDLSAAELAKPQKYDATMLLFGQSSGHARPASKPAPVSTPNGQTQSLTRGQWKSKVTKNFGWLPGVPLTAQAGRFQQVMGQPDDTQTLSDQTLWYYRCADGTIQLSMSALNLQMAGYMQAEINDY